MFYYVYSLFPTDDLVDSRPWATQTQVLPIIKVTDDIDFHNIVIPAIQFPTDDLVDSRPWATQCKLLRIIKFTHDIGFQQMDDRLELVGVFSLFWVKIGFYIRFCIFEFLSMFF